MPDWWPVRVQWPPACHAAAAASPAAQDGAGRRGEFQKWKNEFDKRYATQADVSPARSPSARTHARGTPLAGGAASRPTVPVLRPAGALQYPSMPARPSCNPGTSRLPTPTLAARGRMPPIRPGTPSWMALSGGIGRWVVAASAVVALLRPLALGRADRRLPLSGLPASPTQPQPGGITVVPRP